MVETIESGVGEQNRCAVDLRDFATDFGLQEAVGKKLILCSEADVDRRYTNAIVDKIKRLTGNDCVNVKRKFKGALSVRFNSKILAVSNNLLRLMDESGALFDRLIPLQFTRRVDDFATPDPNFPQKLKAELPGIVLLALRGWNRLRDNGGFTLPDVSKRILDDIRASGSPVQTFIKEVCKIEPDAFTPTDDLWKVWTRFCHDRHIPTGGLEDFIPARKLPPPNCVRIGAAWVTVSVFAVSLVSQFSGCPDPSPRFFVPGMRVTAHPRRVFSRSI